MGTFEGEVAQQQVEQQHSQRPHVHRLVVRHRPQYLGGHVVLRAAVGVGSHLYEPGQSEVPDFTQPAPLLPLLRLLHEDVLQLYVPVHDLVAVDHLHSFQYLIEDVQGLVDWEDFVAQLALNGVKVPHVAVLHYKEVPVSFCIE